MKATLLLICCFVTLELFAQNETTVVDISKDIDKKKWSNDESTIKVFYGQRLFNAKMVEVLHKGVMAFIVILTFVDISGINGVTKIFSGLDRVSERYIVC